MKRLLVILIFLVLAVWLGVKIASDPGYLLLANNHWTVEMPLWLGIFLFLLAIFVAYGLIRLTYNIATLPKLWRRWRKQRHNKYFLRFLNQGFLALLTGDWHLAEKKFCRATTYSTQAWLAYVGAARAAHQQSEYARRDHYLQQAYKEVPEATLAIGIEQATFQLQQHHNEQAVAILQHLQQTTAKQKQTLCLLAQAYQRLGEWEKLFKLLPALKQQKVFSAKEMQALEEQITTHLFRNVTQQNNQALQALWQKLSRDHRNNPKILANYATYLMQHNVNNEAEELLRKYLSKNWDSDLMNLYSCIASDNIDKQLALAEKWLSDHSQNPRLLLALGRLCLRNQLWGKARSYLETSLHLEARVETYQELAKLYEHLHEPEQAYSCYRQGLSLCAKSSSF